MTTNDKMSRRGVFDVKLLVILGSFVFFLFGIYNFHFIKMELKKTKDKLQESKTQHESMSAQLEVVYEHKNRLQNSLDQEKLARHKQESELEGEKEKCQTANKQLQDKLDDTTQQLTMFKSQNDDLQDKVSRCSEDLLRLQTDKEQREQQDRDEYSRFKQEKEFEISKLKDENADLSRRLQESSLSLQGLQEKNQHLQLNQNAPVQQQQQQAAFQSQFQQPVQQQQFQQPAQQQFQQPIQQQQQQPVQYQQVQADQQVLAAGAQQDQAGAQQVPFAGAQQDQGAAVDQQQQMAGVNQFGAQPMVQQKQEQPANDMQINGPGQKAYFEPKVPEPVEGQQQQQLVQQPVDVEGGKVVNEQVLPPHVEEGGPMRQEVQEQEVQGQEVNNPAGKEDGEVGGGGPILAGGGPMQPVQRGAGEQMELEEEEEEEEQGQAPDGNRAAEEEQENDLGEEEDAVLRHAPVNKDGQFGALQRPVAPEQDLAAGNGESDEGPLNPPGQPRKIEFADEQQDEEKHQAEIANVRGQAL